MRYRHGDEGVAENWLEQFPRMETSMQPRIYCGERRIPIERMDERDHAFNRHNHREDGGQKEEGRDSGQNASRTEVGRVEIRPNKLQGVFGTVLYQHQDNSEHQIGEHEPKAQVPREGAVQA